MKVVRINLGVVLILFFSFYAMAQKSPQGTVRLKSSKTGVKHATFIDIIEVTIQYWRDFLYWTELQYGKESAEYAELLPDSTIFAESRLKFGYPAYRNHPMIGISYEQAMKYCAWRSDMLNEWLKLQKNKKKYGYTVTYSLPSETDFQVAYKQQKIKTDYKELTDVTKYRCNHWISYKMCKPKKGKIGYIADNAQEITANKTVITGEDAGKLIFEPYQEPNAKTGFRCVAEIELIKK